MKTLLLFIAISCQAQVIVRTVCGPGGPVSQSVPVSAGEQVNAQTGTSYTYQNSDCGKLVTHSNGSSIAGTLPQANSTTFRNGWFVDVENRGAGTLTITPTTSTIDGASSLALTTNRGVRIISNGTNYFTQRGGAGIAAGSVAVTTNALVGDGSGNAVAATGTGTDCVLVNGSSGSCGGGGGGSFVLIEQHSGNNTSTALNLTSCFTSTYDDYQIELVNIIPAGVNPTASIQMSTDGGMTYDTGSNYAYAAQFVYASSGTTHANNSASANGIVMLGNLAATPFGLSGTIKLHDPLNASLNKAATFNVTNVDTSISTVIHYDGAGYYMSNTAVNAIRLILSTGNIVSGAIRCYGLAK